MGTTVVNDTLNLMAENLGIELVNLSPALKALAVADHRYLKDLKINVGNALNFENLSRKEAYLIALGVAYNEKVPLLSNAFEKKAKAEGATEAEIAETAACVSLMNVNNVFYRFRHFTNKEYYNTTPAGIKMSVMMNPVLGKEFFELLSLVISSVNGCEMCVNSHEESVIKHGASQSRVYDAVRLGSVIKGLCVLV